MRGAGAVVIAALIFMMPAAAACKHVVRVPGGDIRIFQDSEPVGPISTAETRSGGSCGPGLPPCPGGTDCFDTGGESICLTEEAACKAAGCAGALCEIVESSPARAVCH